MSSGRSLAMLACLCALGAQAFRTPAPGVAHAGAHGASSVVMSSTPGEVVTKKNERRRIMTSDNYKRGGSPFDKDIHKDIQQKMSAQFAGELVEQMKESPFRELEAGEGDSKVTFVLAKEFGFCWGVERSIELAWAARNAYPDKTMHITNELIHNPGVNQLLEGMDVKFIEKDADAEQGKRFDTVDEGDVVILPAFGASLEEMQLLDQKGVTTVDTTCPWVSKVWTVVDKHQKAAMTSIIHGKYAHEEAIATASMCETYLIIKDMKQAEEIASYILQEPGCLTDEELLAKYKHAASPHFDPKKHLKKIGIANQTTMYKKETQAIGRMFEKTMMAAFGPEKVKEHFAAFDTICDATQVRQDAVQEMSERHVEEPLDFVLVVGGWDSSNTAHLLEIPHDAGLTGYHVNVAGCIRPDNSVEHRTVDGAVEVQQDFVPLDRSVRIGVTSGASTPDSVVQECLEQVIMLKKLGAKPAAAAEPAAAF